MSESYTRQALPSKKYRELIGTAICVFNSNNSFVIENILRADQTGKYEWHKLIDETSGDLDLLSKKRLQPVLIQLLQSFLVILLL